MRKKFCIRVDEGREFDEKFTPKKLKLGAWVHSGFKLKKKVQYMEAAFEIDFWNFIQFLSYCYCFKTQK